MNYSEITAIVDDINYKPDWRIINYKSPEGRPYIQITVMRAMDSVTKELTAYRSAKAYLSSHMCRQEIVGAVYGLIQATEMHEMREWFRYQGVSIYNPHIDPDVLVEVGRYQRNFNVRRNAMSMEET